MRNDPSTKKKKIPARSPEIAHYATLVAEGNYATPAGEKLFQTAVNCLGRDMAPKETELACAETIWHMVFAAFGDKLGAAKSAIRSTIALGEALATNPAFVRVRKPLPGDIALYVTGEGNGALAHGHVGIVGQESVVMSNDSADGIFKENYTLETFRKRYEVEGGFPAYYFRRLTLT